MPDEWVRELEKTALKLNEELISELLEQISEPNNLLAQALQDILDNLDLDSILNLTQETIISHLLVPYSSLFLG